MAKVKKNCKKYSNKKAKLLKQEKTSEIIIVLKRMSGEEIKRILRKYNIKSKVDRNNKKDVGSMISIKNKDNVNFKYNLR